MAIDPVCQMDVDEKDHAGTSEYGGKTYYFCAPGCKTRFDADPPKYVRGDAPQENLPRQ
jgi:YHS domain-containing protein